MTQLIYCYNYRRSVLLLLVVITYLFTADDICIFWNYLTQYRQHPIKLTWIRPDLTQLTPTRFHLTRLNSNWPDPTHPLQATRDHLLVW